MKNGTAAGNSGQWSRGCPRKPFQNHQTDRPGDLWHAILRYLYNSRWLLIIYMCLFVDNSLGLADIGARGS